MGGRRCRVWPVAGAAASRGQAGDPRSALLTAEGNGLRRTAGWGRHAPASTLARGWGGGGASCGGELPVAAPACRRRAATVRPAAGGAGASARAHAGARRSREASPLRECNDERDPRRHTGGASRPAWGLVCARGDKSKRSRLSAKGAAVRVYLPQVYQPHGRRSKVASHRCPQWNQTACPPTPTPALHPARPSKRVRPYSLLTVDASLPCSRARR